ncbi:MAG: class I SAM-dependent methyltransferase [Candidatus Thiodiazotropha sp. (ex Ctena orbiculata)]|uniref:Class I SAM-dependent methyltransferase n=1 Tax=Candidatus Thiodiazotropha taylori TaxID=2792791 RepID=A0A944M9E7_9GAMM|nr:class I SAM-dependent methyltransferase [Candidatus Thiodiazotropha taylori]MBT2989744.1 class I SAM-dependent methyltransferase [Candidatus Thiodiazotropha taylori]MBT2995917.1 class I SAM-dependent methyltransferase [Candidatus Thiodiazotropha taylori]MBT2999232.1 class I SAM-dependent methyltransferase [Candidatus Thiodiazotropha taylori]MBT3025999.1 class I SAM-dependent methyltransferase [Candidatus Thiodiazotropha taylori]
MVDKKAHWQNLYREKAPTEVSWHQSEPELSLQLMHSSGIDRDEAVIDVGGGASLLVDYLWKEGFSNLAVLDISGYALSVAKQRLGDAAASIEWYETDVTEFMPPHPFSLWHDRAVFHFLTAKPDREKYIDALNLALRPNGHLVIAAFAIGGPEKCSGLDIVQYDAAKLMRELGKGFELMEEREELHVTPAGGEQKFTYFRFSKTEATV